MAGRLIFASKNISWYIHSVTSLGKVRVVNITETQLVKPNFRSSVLEMLCPLLFNTEFGR